MCYVWHHKYVAWGSDSEKVVYYDFPKRALSVTSRQDGNIVGDDTKWHYSLSNCASS